jgi:hypothetical protein
VVRASERDLVALELPTLFVGLRSPPGSDYVVAWFLSCHPLESQLAFLVSHRMGDGDHHKESQRDQG